MAIGQIPHHSINLLVPIIQFFWKALVNSIPFEKGFKSPAKLALAMETQLWGKRKKKSFDAFFNKTMQQEVLR